ncbi:hypothetical protein H4S02_012562, partial [Coemansia sp. RSA 2611]
MSDADLRLAGRIHRPPTSSNSPSVSSGQQAISEIGYATDNTGRRGNIPDGLAIVPREGASTPGAFEDDPDNPVGTPPSPLIQVDDPMLAKSLRCATSQRLDNNGGLPPALGMGPLAGEPTPMETDSRPAQVSPPREPPMESPAARNASVSPSPATPNTLAAAALPPELTLAVVSTTPTGAVAGSATLSITPSRQSEEPVSRFGSSRTGLHIRDKIARFNRKTKKARDTLRSSGGEDTPEASHSRSLTLSSAGLLTLLRLND